MCKVCELRKKCDLLSEEVEFRIIQYQKETSFGRPEDAADAKEYAMQALADIFNRLDEMTAAIAEVRETSGGLDSFLGKMFKKDEGQFH